jgi:predicted DNA-binding transcriptional regulator AlpA
MTPELRAAFDTLDRAIDAVTPEEAPALTAALAARIAVLAARGMNGEGRQVEVAPDENLSAQAAAARLGMSVAWIYKNRAKLPFRVQIGRRLLFSARGLEKWTGQRQGR